MTVNLLDLDLEGLAVFCERLGEKRFRAVQLFRWIHQKGVHQFDDMSDLAKSFREKLKGAAHIKALQVISRLSISFACELSFVKTDAGNDTALNNPASS